MNLYSRLYYKFLDTKRKLNFRMQCLKYHFHPDIKLGKNVKIWRGVSIEILYGGTIEIGDNTEIMDGCKIWTYGGHIKIGEGCSINPNTIIYGQSKTIIGNNVLIAGQTMIIPSNHRFQDKSKLIKEQGVDERGIVIEDNVWIANGCTILDGVVIKSGSVVAAGAVVNKTVDNFQVVGGVPAKKIKDI